MALDVRTPAALRPSDLLLTSFRTFSIEPSPDSGIGRFLGLTLECDQSGTSIDWGWSHLASPRQRGMPLHSARRRMIIDAQPEMVGPEAWELGFNVKGNRTAAIAVVRNRAVIVHARHVARAQAMGMFHTLRFQQPATFTFRHSSDGPGDEPPSLPWTVSASAGPWGGWPLSRWTVSSCDGCGCGLPRSRWTVVVVWRRRWEE